MKIESWIKIIIDNQQADGAWSDSSGLDPVFLTALMLSSLNRSSLPDLQEAKQVAAAFLFSRKNEDWRFSPNLFINFSVIVALAEYDLEIFDGEALAKILKLLTELEQDLGGPYFSDQKKPHVDLAFNIQVARFLDLFAVELPNLTAYFQDRIETADFSSNYFNSPYPNLYLLSKFYREADKQKISHFLSESGVLDFGRVIDRLFALNARKNFSEEKFFQEENFLQSLENIDKDIERYLMIPVLLLEFFSDKEKVITGDEVENEKIISDIIQLTQKKFAKLSADMRAVAEAEIARTLKKNCDGQMSLMPYFVKKALGEKGKIFSEEFIIQAGLANIFFWNAFIIYDDFWDEEGEPCCLPTANYFARYFIDFYENIFPGDAKFRLYFHNLMDELDQANTWETKHCRARIVGDKFMIPAELPDYGDYEWAYAPASAHILGAVAMLYRLGYDLDSPEINNLENYFRHYLIAMQINDDAMDWEEDLERGHLSTVVVMLVKKYLQKYPDEDFIDLSEDNREELKKFYWYEVVEAMCVEVLAQTTLAREALSKLPMFEDEKPLEKLIKVTEQVAQNTLHDYKKKAEFLENFSLELT